MVSWNEIMVEINENECSYMFFCDPVGTRCHKHFMSYKFLLPVKGFFDFGGNLRFCFFKLFVFRGQYVYLIYLNHRNLISLSIQKV
jgi:hypothetical protein